MMQLSLAFCFLGAYVTASSAACEELDAADSYYDSRDEELVEEFLQKPREEQEDFLKDTFPYMLEDYISPSPFIMGNDNVARWMDYLTHTDGADNVLQQLRSQKMDQFEWPTRTRLSPEVLKSKALECCEHRCTMGGGTNCSEMCMEGIDERRNLNFKGELPVAVLI